MGFFFFLPLLLGALVLKRPFFLSVPPSTRIFLLCVASLLEVQTFILLVREEVEFALFPCYPSGEIRTKEMTHPRRAISQVSEALH